MPTGTFRRDGLVLGAATGLFGVSFGVLAATAGLSLAKTMALSLLVFTGASQFAAVSVAAAGGNGFAAVGGALLLAARNGVYGLSVAGRLVGRHRWLTRLVGAQLIIDESTAMAVAQPNAEEGRQAFWITGLSVFVFWNLGTVLGAVGGGRLADPAALGLDAAFPAGFIALLPGHIPSRAGRVAAIVGALAALVSLPVLPVGGPILASLAGVAAGIGVLRRTPQAARTAGGALDPLPPPPQRPA